MMKIPVFTIALSLIFRVNLAAGQGLPPGWDYTPTNVDHIIAVRLTTNPNINGVPLEAGDYIGVFYYSDGIQYCGGAEEWNGTSNIAIIAYGDDVTTPSKDGFYTGESFNWRVYSWSLEMEYEAIVTYDPAYAQNDGTFYPYGISALESFDADDLTVTVSVADDTVCEGAGTQLFSSVSGASGVYTYNWSSAPSGFTSGDPGPVINPSVDTRYYLEVTTYLAAATDSVDVTVIPTALQYLYLQNETVSDSEDFTGNVIAAGQAVTDPPEGPFIIETGAIVNFEGGDTVYLKDGFSAQSGCEFRAFIGDIACLQVPPLLPGIVIQQETDNGIIMYAGSTDTWQSISIFPNPSEGIFLVHITGLNHEEMSCEVVDLMGNVVFDRTRITDSVFVINLESRPNGIYLVRMMSRNGTKVTKLIKR